MRRYPKNTNEGEHNSVDNDIMPRDTGSILDDSQDQRKRRVTKRREKLTPIGAAGESYLDEESPDA